MLVGIALWRARFAEDTPHCDRTLRLWVAAFCVILMPRACNGRLRNVGEEFVDVVKSPTLRQLRGLGLGAFPDPWRQFPRRVSATHGTSAAPPRHILEMPVIVDFFALKIGSEVLFVGPHFLLSPAILICFKACVLSIRARAIE